MLDAAARPVPVPSAAQDQLTPFKNTADTSASCGTPSRCSNRDSLNATSAKCVQIEYRGNVKANVEVLKTANIEMLSTHVRLGGQASFGGSVNSVKRPALRFSRSR